MMPALPHQPLIQGFDSDNGLMIETPSGYRITHIFPEIETEDRVYSTQKDSPHIAINDNAISFDFGPLRLDLHIAASDDDIVQVAPTVVNTSANDCRVKSVSPLRFRGEWGYGGPFRTAWRSEHYSWPAERNYGYDGTRYLHDGAPVVSCWFYGFHDQESRENFFIGIDDAPAGFVRFAVSSLMSNTPYKRVVRWSCDIDTLAGNRGVRIPSGGTLSTGGLFLHLWRGAHHEGRERVANRLAIRFPLRHAEHRPTGWCSWYAGYEKNISEIECRRNLSEIRNYEGLHFFQIDDGWMTEETRSADELHSVDRTKFPNGFAALFDEARQNGMQPGLWLRPFMGRRPALSVPDFLRGDCIDLSHPEAREWLLRSATRLKAKTNMAYAKLDFLTYDFYGAWGMELLSPRGAAFEPFDDSVTNIQAYTTGLRALRQALGDDCFILGCNTLLGSSLGVVDGFRSGDDISAAHEERFYYMGAKSTEPLEFLNGKVLWLDPDCIVVHEPLAESLATAWAVFVALTNGAAFVSSKLFALSKQRRDILQFCFPARTYPTHTHTTAFGLSTIVAQVKTTWEEYALIGLFNWSPHSLHQRIDFASIGLGEPAYLYCDALDRDFAGETQGFLDYELSPHSCRLLVVRKNLHRPQLLATTKHYSQGDYEFASVLWNDGTLALHLQSQLEETFEAAIYVPSRYALKENGKNGIVPCTVHPSGDTLEFALRKY